MRVWNRVDCLSINILSYVPFILSNNPTAKINIIEGEISAWIGFIASDDTWWENTTNTLDVSQSEISHCYSWLSLAILQDRVEHAAWTSTTWLSHLLRSYVDCKPNWSIHGDILIQDVFNDSISIITWVALDVDTLERKMLHNISECNISNTVVSSVRRNRPDGHTNSHIGD